MNEFDDDALAMRARELHGQALAAISPRTRAQLHNRLQALAMDPKRKAGGIGDWRWVAAPALALALAFGLPWDATQVPAADDSAQIAAAAAAAMEVPVAALEQDPEFYAWLASADAVALASE